MAKHTEQETYAQLQALASAEQTTRRLYNTLVAITYGAGVPVWLVRFYNALADLVNTDILAVIAIVKAGDPSTPDPVLVPRVVPATAPDDVGFTSLDANAVLSPTDLATLNSPTAGQRRSEVAGVTGGVPGTFGLVWWAIPIIVGGIALGLGGGVLLVSYAWNMGALIDYKRAKLEADRQEARFARIAASVEACVAEGRSRLDCWQNVPDVLKKEVPPLPRPSISATGVAIILLSSGVAIGAGLYLYRLFRRGGDEGRGRVERASKRRRTLSPYARSATA